MDSDDYASLCLSIDSQGFHPMIKYWTAATVEKTADKPGKHFREEIANQITMVANRLYRDIDNSGDTYGTKKAEICLMVNLHG